MKTGKYGPEKNAVFGHFSLSASVLMTWILIQNFIVICYVFSV